MERKKKLNCALYEKITQSSNELSKNVFVQDYTVIKTSN